MHIKSVSELPMGLGGYVQDRKDFFSHYDLLSLKVLQLPEVPNVLPLFISFLLPPSLIIINNFIPSSQFQK